MKASVGPSLFSGPSVFTYRDEGFYPYPVLARVWLSYKRSAKRSGSDESFQIQVTAEERKEPDDPKAG
jgi:hypothetical protein